MDEILYNGITIRHPIASDAQGMVEFLDSIRNEPGLFIAWGPTDPLPTVEQEMELIEKWSRTTNSTFIIALDGEKVISILNITGYLRARVAHFASLGITIHSDYRDRGIGTRMMQAAIDWTKNESSIKRLELTVACENLAALYIYEKIGFVIEGKRRATLMMDGHSIDDYLMSMIIE